MAKKTNPKLIGAFVIGGIALAVAGLLAFGGASYFVTKQPAVLFFEGSLGGLAVGAPVNFRGVQVGTVTAIVIHYDAAEQKIEIPVSIEIEPEKFQIVGGERKSSNIGLLVERGLRAQLQVQSLVTGQASVEFDFHPDTPIHYMSNGQYGQELPTIPSTMDTLQANVADLLGKLSKMPLDEIAQKISNSIDELHQTLTDADGLVKGVAVQIAPVLGNLQQATADASSLIEEVRARFEMKPGEPLQTVDETLDEYRALAQQLQAQLGPIGADAQSSLAALHSALGRLDGLVAMIERDYSKNPALLLQASETLREFKSMAASFRAFADYLQRNPNALLTGKK